MLRESKEGVSSSLSKVKSRGGKGNFSILYFLPISRKWSSEDLVFNVFGFYQLQC